MRITFSKSIPLVLLCMSFAMNSFAKADSNSSPSSSALISTDQNVVEVQDAQNMIVIKRDMNVATFKSFLWLDNGETINVYSSNNMNTPLSSRDQASDTEKVILFDSTGHPLKTYDMYVGFPDTFAQQGNIKGAVTDENGRPLQNIGVQFNSMDTYGSSAFFSTRPDGRFSGESVPPNGAYRFMVSSPASTDNQSVIYSQAVQLSDAYSSFYKQIVFISGQSSKYGCIQGTISDTNGNPVRASVVIRPIDRSDREWVAGTSWTNGTYSVGGLPDGQYSIFIQKFPTTDIFLDDSGNPVGTSNVTIVSGQVQSLDYTVSLTNTGANSFADITPPSAPDRPVSVQVDGSSLLFDQLPVEVNDRTLVPLRKIFETLGAEVAWDEGTQTVTAIKDKTIVKLSIGSTIAKINGNPVTLDVPAQKINDRTMVPVRFVSEALGAHVSFDDATQTVMIQTK